MAQIPTVFIDGEAGTTGLEIRRRIESRNDIRLLNIDSERRKDPGERSRMLNACDVAILCLPDAAAREAIQLIKNAEVKVIDASTAHRTDPDWTYGFAELAVEQRHRIRASKRVSNPGCYPTGALALIRPLIDAKILPRACGITINAISGYSGGGKELIHICEDPAERGHGRAAGFCLYGLEQTHKHLPEIRVHGRLDKEPIFLPSYSNAFYRGMLVYIPLRMSDLRQEEGKSFDGQAVHGTFERHFAGASSIKLDPLFRKLEPGFVLTPLDENDTDRVRLRVFENAEKGTLILAATLDNLGKGAAGAAVQNLDLMLGREA